MIAWPKVPLRRLFRIVNGGTPTADAENWDGDVPWATPVDLGLCDGAQITSTQRTLTHQGLRTGSAAVPSGSLVVSTRAPIGYVAQTIAPLAFNQGCRGLRPEQSLDVRYYRYVMGSLIAQLISRGQGSTFIELSSDALASTRVPKPPLEAQIAIADFLDVETTRLDELVEKDRALINLMSERFWNYVSTAVLSASTRTVPLRRFLVSINDGPFGSSLTSQHYSDSGARVVRLGNIGLAEFKNEDRAYVPDEHYQELLLHRVRPGNLLMAGLGDQRNHVGRACVAPDLGRAIVKADCYCAVVDSARASAEFLSLLLSSPVGAERVAMAARGTTRSRINLDIAKEIGVPEVTIEVQAGLVDEANQMRSRLYEIRERMESEILLLRERRRALVTAAITGELEIPGTAA